MWLKQCSLRVISVRITFREIYGLETFILHTVISMKFPGGDEFILLKTLREGDYLRNEIHLLVRRNENQISIEKIKSTTSPTLFYMKEFLNYQTFGKAISISGKRTSTVRSTQKTRSANTHSKTAVSYLFLFWGKPKWESWKLWYFTSIKLTPHGWKVVLFIGRTQCVGFCVRKCLWTPNYYFFCKFGIFR